MIDPGCQMGVFTSIGEVPDRYRLQNYTAQFDGETVFDEFIEKKQKPIESKETWLRVIRSKREWCEYTRDIDIHSALCQPQHVETFVKEKINEFSYYQVYSYYLMNLTQFYDWLLNSINFPHIYQPVRMAMLNHEEASQAWKTWRKHEQ